MDLTTNFDAVATAIRNKLQVSLSYQKKTTGEIVQHTGGIYEIGANKSGETVIWLWDTMRNDTIRQFLVSNIIDFQVLNIPFQTNGMWPLKINGEIVGV
jgi:predicted DNA-binding transcriptional regulator YafY